MGVKRLRFKDENGIDFPDWKKELFSSFYIKAKEGGTPNTKNKEFYTEGEIPFVKIEDLSRKYISYTYYKINESGLKNSSAWIVPKNSVLLSNGATIGDTSINRIEVATKQGILGIIPKVNEEFLYYLLNSENFRKKLKAITTRGTMEAAYINDIAKLVLKKPDSKEQEKIGNFLSLFDRLIEKLETKIGLLKELKKGYLQQMFPAKGEKVPKIRFAGFSEKWEMYTIGEYSNFRRGSFPQPYGNSEWYGGTDSMPFVQVIDVGESLRLLDKTKQRISKIAQPSSVHVKTGMVIVTLQGSIGRVAITHYDCYIDRTLLVFQNYLFETNATFWAYEISRIFDLEKTRAPGGTIKTITKKALENFNVKTPLYYEQEKIGNFFKNLDSMIEKHEKELDAIEQLKKGYMQRLFA